MQGALREARPVFRLVGFWQGPHDLTVNVCNGSEAKRPLCRILWLEADSPQPAQQQTVGVECTPIRSKVRLWVVSGHQI